MLKWSAILGVAAIVSGVLVVSGIPQRFAAIAMALMLLFLVGAAALAIPAVMAAHAEDGHPGTAQRRRHEPDDAD